MPARLHPTAPIAADAVLVGDPGRALLLAQELLEQPKMSNHARGLWGYSGDSLRGGELTIQATGMGGPSAALVLAELAELGVRRAVRIGTCFGGEAKAGELLLVERAIAVGGSATSFGLAVGESATPDPALTAALGDELGETAKIATVASFDLAGESDQLPTNIDAGDLQTVAVLTRARALGIAAAAILIAETGTDGGLSDGAREAAAKQAGEAAAAVLST